MKQIRWCVPVLLVCAILPIPAAGSQLGTAGLWNVGAWSAVSSGVRLQLSVRDRFSGALLVSLLDTIVDPQDVGRSFAIHSGNTLTEISRVLANGVNDAILLGVDPALAGYGGPPNSGGSGPFESEAFLFFGDRNEAHRPDFVGFAITSVNFKLTEVSVDSPGEDPNGDGIWTNHRVTGTLTVYGAAIPEASTLLLTGCGLICLCTRALLLV